MIKCLSNEQNISRTSILQSASVKTSGILQASFSSKQKITNKTNTVDHNLWLHYYLIGDLFLKYGINSTFNQSW